MLGCKNGDAAGIGGDENNTVEFSVFVCVARAALPFNFLIAVSGLETKNMLEVK